MASVETFSAPVVVGLGLAGSLWRSLAIGGFGASGLFRSSLSTVGCSFFGGSLFLTSFGGAGLRISTFELAGAGFRTAGTLFAGLAIAVGAGLLAAAVDIFPDVVEAGAFCVWVGAGTFFFFVTRAIMVSPFIVAVR